MQSPNLSSLIRRVSLASAALMVAAGSLGAQTAISPDQSGSSPISSGSNTFSSSDDPRLPQISELAPPTTMAALPSAPSPSSSAAAQSDRGGRGWRQNTMSRLAFEVGGGFNAPKSSSITYGGNITVGGGINFSRQFALLAEYQFIDDKLPGALIAETGATGGHAHIWSLTLDPVVSLFPKSENDIYVTGGGGFYRKVTSFTDPQQGIYCDYFYGYCYGVVQNVVVGHFSSNQGGWNIGAGYQHRMGGMYGDSKMKLFVEGRYVDVLTPAVTGITPSGLGVTTVAADTKMIPVTVGVRW